MTPEHPGDRAFNICDALCRAFEKSPKYLEILQMAGRLDRVLDELGNPAVRAALAHIAASNRIAIRSAESLSREESQIANEMATIDGRCATIESGRRQEAAKAKQPRRKKKCAA